MKLMTTAVVPRRRRRRRRRKRRSKRISSGSIVLPDSFTPLKGLQCLFHGSIVVSVVVAVVVVTTTRGGQVISFSTDNRYVDYSTNI